MITRRQFLKTSGLLGLYLMLPSFLGEKNARSAILDNINYVPPSVMPQVINIFLYGGPSELAGNLTNIEDINANSQNAYPFSLDPNNVDNDITPNNFWGAAGGWAMEDLLANGDMSVYRTINRLKDDSKAHGRSITQNLVGNLDLFFSGIATTLAAILATFNPFDKEINELILPFVSFEGESVAFNLGDLEIPQVLRPVTIGSNLQNPYQRNKNWYLDSSEEDTNDAILDDLAQSVSTQGPASHNKVNEAFAKRADLADYLEQIINPDIIFDNLPIDPDTNQPIQYPNNSFGEKLLGAVSLAVMNPDTVFISLGGEGLGGWDDHSGALEDYPPRMQALMDALEVAAKHMRLAGAGNIVINIFGDFGRNVNVNNSMGWDHGNNQNFYTLGGSAIAGRTLGKLVGKTKRIGTPFENRQYTSPKSSSYQCEPFATASSMFKYFGVQNPEILTGERSMDESDDIPNELG
jgi:hypothetical protein